ncbi:MAG: HIT domain-containing protein [Candidatus Nanoarchaeia archaeon]|nr:HIT domain-containing protein [Candidatus Nanoarchaeia archaeon]MDD5053940.1 HIT domain-containing protein [Candidatus Nanoarchaeia archaeon]
MDGCVFCKIAQKKIKSDILYEDDFVLAFLDNNPVSKNHALIIPKSHYENIFDVPKEELMNVVFVAKELALKYKKDWGVSDVNLLNASGKNAQQSVFHFHFHLVPRHENDGLNLWLK